MSITEFFISIGALLAFMGFLFAAEGLIDFWFTWPFEE